MDEPDPCEPGNHVFTGTIKVWGSGYGELLTDSGVTVLLATPGQPQVPNGTRVTVVTRRFRPRYRIDRIYKAD